MQDFFCLEWSLSLSSFLSSESRSNACIDYAESQKKYSRAQTTASSLRRFIQSLRSSRHFCFSSLKMRCPLRFLTHFLNASHTQKCIPAQSRCLFIESPQRNSVTVHPITVPKHSHSTTDARAVRPYFVLFNPQYGLRYGADISQPKIA